MDTPHQGFGRFFLAALAIFTLVFLLLPLIVVVGVSLTEANFMTFPPQGLSLKWYDAVIHTPIYVDAFWLSLQLATLATLISLLLGVPASIILARRSFAGSRAIASLFLSPLILPTVVIGVAVLQFAAMLGFALTFTSLLIGHVLLVIPYVIRATLVSLSGFDLSTEEAAQDLGAGMAETLWLVTLPQIKPGVIAGALLGFIISWINVEVSIFNSTSSLITLPVRIFNQVQASVDPSMAAVSAVTIYFAILAVLALDYFVGVEKAGMN